MWRSLKAQEDEGDPRMYRRLQEQSSVMGDQGQHHGRRGKRLLLLPLKEGRMDGAPSCLLLQQWMDLRLPLLDVVVEGR